MAEGWQEADRGSWDSWSEKRLQRMVGPHRLPSVYRLDSGDECDVVVAEGIDRKGREIYSGVGTQRTW